MWQPSSFRELQAMHRMVMAGITVAWAVLLAWQLIQWWRKRT